MEAASLLSKGHISPQGLIVHRSTRPNPSKRNTYSGLAAFDSNTLVQVGLCVSDTSP